jgi:UDP-N-acetylmuramate dehydrogenase
LITHVSLRVRRDAPAEIQRRIAEFAQLRRRTQPNTPSVGSMFKNPPGDFAGRLIEAAGLKGHAVGGARISEIHANFFVNAGTATAADVDALIATARDAVAEAFGVRLDLEIERLGGDDG